MARTEKCDGCGAMFDPRGMGRHVKSCSGTDLVRTTGDPAAPPNVIELHEPPEITPAQRQEDAIDGKPLRKFLNDFLHGEI